MSAPSQRALTRHREACDRGEAGYIDPDTGLFVMTSHYLIERGFCCGNGCRHCPYPAEVQAEAGRPARPSWPERRSG